MKGILFSEQLFPLVVNGTKTQARRIIKPQPDVINTIEPSLCYHGDHNYIKPHYKVGEICYLKEPYYDWDEDSFWDGCEYQAGRYSYKYDGEQLPYKDVKWKNKLFMPESAARYFIEITGVMAEKLQNISEEYCFKEGIIKKGFEFQSKYQTAKHAYSDLIDSINGEGTWESNPYVWVYDFKLVYNSKK